MAKPQGGVEVLQLVPCAVSSHLMGGSWKEGTHSHNLRESWVQLGPGGSRGCRKDPRAGTRPGLPWSAAVLIRAAIVSMP